jgi:Flp pilus assembly pilin Flp
MTGGEQLNARLQRFWCDETGAELVEWAMVAAILVAATIPPLILLRNAFFELIATSFNSVTTEPPTP